MTDISIFRYDVLYVYIYLLAMAVKTSVLEKTQKRRKEIVITVKQSLLRQIILVIWKWKIILS